MTDAELRDAALAKFAEELAHLQKTTRGLKGFNPPASSEWGKALAARGEGLSLLAQIPQAQDPSDTPDPPEPTGIFTGDFETGDLRQWDLRTDWQGPNGSFSVVPSGTGGVPSRDGSHMGRVDIRSGDGKFGPGTNVCMVGTTKWTPPDRSHYELVGDDRYYGFSVYVPSAGFHPSPAKFNYIAELHGDTSGQAPVKLNLDPTTNPVSWSTELHVQDVAPAGAWNPTYIRNVGPVKFDSWTDFVWHVNWQAGSSGKVEMWINGALVSTYDGPTWGSMSYVKRALGCYRQDTPQPWVFYVDAYRVGTTRAAVTPQ